MTGLGCGRMMVAPLLSRTACLWRTWLGGLGTAARCGRIPSRDLSPVLAGPRRAHFLRGGAPRPALGRLGKARGEGGSRLRPRALQRPPPGPRRFPGPWT